MHGCAVVTEHDPASCATLSPPTGPGDPPSGDAAGRSASTGTATGSGRPERPRCCGTRSTCAGCNLLASPRLKSRSNALFLIFRIATKHSVYYTDTMAKASLQKCRSMTRKRSRLRPQARNPHATHSGREPAAGRLSPGRRDREPRSRRAGWQAVRGSFLACISHGAARRTA